MTHDSHLTPEEHFKGTLRYNISSTLACTCFSLFIFEQCITSHVDTDTLVPLRQSRHELSLHTTCSRRVCLTLPSLRSRPLVFLRQVSSSSGSGRSCCRLCAVPDPADLWGCKSFMWHIQRGALNKKKTGEVPRLHTLLLFFLFSKYYLHIFKNTCYRISDLQLPNNKNSSWEQKYLMTKENVIKALNTEKTFKFFFFSFIVFFFNLIFNHFWTRPLKLCSSDCAAYIIYSWCC